MSKFKKILTGAALMGSIAVANGQQILKRITDNSTYTIVDLFSVRNGTTPNNVIGSGGINVGQSDATGSVVFWSPDGSQSFSALSSTNGGAPTIPNEVVGNGTFETLLSGAGTRITRENNEGLGTYFDVSVPTLTTHRDEISDGNTNIDMLHFQASLPKILNNGSPIPTGTWATFSSISAADLATGLSAPGPGSLGFQFNGTTRVQQATNRLGQSFTTMQNADLPAETPPIMNTIGNTNGTEGTWMSYTIPAATPTNGDPITTYTMTGGLPSGITFNNTTRVLSGTPGIGTVGNYPLSVTATDNDGTSLPATFTLTIAAIGNNNPVANNDLYTILEDGTIILTLLSNDTDVDGNTLNIGSINGITLTGGAQNINTTNGVVNISAGGTITFIPNANYNGQETFPYTINDGNGGTSSATITINLDEVNDNPAANNDSYTTPEDNAITVTPLVNDTDVDVSNVLNISDINGTTLTGGAQNISVPNGTINISAGGTITFTPNLDYFGSVTFPYTINDGNGGTSSATITITVSAINDNPIANNDSYNTTEDNNIVLNPLNNDTDVDGNTLSMGSINGTTLTGGAQNTSAPNGTIDISASGVITFIPNLNYNGPATFPYTTNDGNGGTATANITITVNAVNDTPTGNDTEYTLLKNTNQDFDVTSQTNDVDGPNATYTISTQPLHGTAIETTPGNYTYTPNNNFVGEDSLYVIRSDGGIPNESVIVKVKFTVDDDSGIEEIKNLDINIYPNPTTEYLAITTPDNVPTVSYEIYDMNKKLVDMGKYSNGDHIDVSRFQSGVYIIQCTDTSNSKHTTIQEFTKN